MDRAALENLKKVPLLPKLIEYINIPYTSMSRLKHFGSFLRVNEKQLPSVYGLMREACKILEVDEPYFYINPESEINAYVSCSDKPIVCVSGYLVDVMDDEELMFVIGHELAHIKSGHLRYKPVGEVLRQGILDSILSSIPGVGLASGGVIIALNYAYFQWYQAGEFTCDRGGFLACQNFEASCRALMKLAGSSQRYISELNLEEFMKQAHEFESVGFETLGNIQKIILSYGATHPQTIARAFELQKFKENGLYSDILQRNTTQGVKHTPPEPPAPVSKENNVARETVDKAKSIAGNMLSKFKI